MDYIKLFEEFISRDEEVVRYKVYLLKEETDSEIEVIDGIWNKKDDAKNEAKYHDSYFEDGDSYISMTTYELEIPIGEIIEFHEIDLDEFSKDYDNYTFKYIEEGIKDIYNYVVDDEYETVREIPYENYSTDKIIELVIDKLNDYFGVRDRFSKYTTLYKDDEDNLTFESDNGLDYDDLEYKEYEQVTIRIADHTHNPRNGFNDLNVLISNKDYTANKFFTASSDLRYNEDDDPDEIVDDIVNFWK
jgi:hypothetical protein